LQHHKNSDFCLQQNSFGHYFDWIFLLATIFLHKSDILLLLKKKIPHIVKLFIFKSTIFVKQFFLLHGNLRIFLGGCEIFSSQKY
jgi:hypothetical protein